MLERRWASLIVVCSALLVISLDNTILHIALPAIQSNFNASLSELQWIISSYVLVFASLLLTMGTIGDRLGRKPIFIAGMVLFGIASLAATLTRSTGMLIATRALMGLGAAVVMPATLSTVTATFHNPRERAQAIAIWAAVFGLGVGIGPVMGGFLLEHFNWHAVFLINVPVVFITLLAGQRYIDNSYDEAAAPVDAIGVVLSICGLFALVYGIIEAGVKGWGAPDVVLAFSLAVLLLLYFACWEGITDNPMLPISLFQNPTFSVASVSLGLVTFVMFGLLLMLSPFLQLIQGYTPLETGLKLLPIALFGALSAALSARVVRILGLKTTILTGLLITIISMIVSAESISVHVSYGWIVFVLSLGSFGLGLVVSPSTNMIMSTLPANKAGIGSAMNDTTRQLGGTLGVAVIGTIINGVYIDNMNTLMNSAPIQAVMNLFPADQVEQAVQYVRSSLQGAHGVAAEILTQSPENMRQIAGRVSDLLITNSNQAFVTGSAHALWFGVIIMIATTLFALWLLPESAPTSVHDHTTSYLPHIEPEVEREAVPVIGD